MKFFTSAKTFVVGMLMLSSTTKAADEINKEDFDTCYGCAAQGPGGMEGKQTNYMCKAPEGIQLRDNKGVVCCQPGINDEKSFCKQEEPSCTPAFKYIPYKWWLACPQATAENCGGQKVITAYPKSQKWGMSNMRLSVPAPGGGAWKIKRDPKYDLCWWVFTTEKGKWANGKFKIKFSKIGNIIINAFGAEKPDDGKDQPNGGFPDLVKNIFDFKTKPEVGKEYELDIKYNLLIQAIPVVNTEETDFEFEFKVDGEEIPYYMQYHEWLKDQEDPEGTYIWNTIAAGFVCICLLGMPIGCCIMCCIQKKNDGQVAHNQIVDTAQTGNAYDTHKGNIPAYDHQTSGQEMELESLDNHSQEKTYQPSQKSQSEYVANNYANPFKKQRK